MDTLLWSHSMAQDTGPPTTQRLEDWDDEALAEAFQSGEVRAFEVLFDRYAGRVRGLMMRLTGDAALARDLTQVAFLSVVRGRGRFTGGGRFKPWLFTVAMNALRDHARRRKREVLEAEPPETPVSAPTPDHALERSVHEALAALSKDQREAVVLHHVHGFTFKEVATMVGCSVSAAKVRAHRGNRRLRELLHETAWEALGVR